MAELKKYIVARGMRVSYNAPIDVIMVELGAALSKIPFPMSPAPTLDTYTTYPTTRNQEQYKMVGAILPPCMANVVMSFLSMDDGYIKLDTPTTMIGTINNSSFKYTTVRFLKCEVNTCSMDLLNVPKCAGATFRDCTFNNTIFYTITNTTFIRCSFQSIKIVGNVENVRMVSCRGNYIKILRISINGVIMRRSKFTNMDIIRSDIREMAMFGCGLSHITSIMTNMSSSIIKFTLISNLVVGGNSIMNNVDIVRCHIRRGIIQAVTIHNCDIYSVELTNIIIETAEIYESMINIIATNVIIGTLVVRHSHLKRRNYNSYISVYIGTDTTGDVIKVSHT
jgi:uncharacterized protein YjbI with pentapeptide repeats